MCNNSMVDEFKKFFSDVVEERKSNPPISKLTYADKVKLLLAIHPEILERKAKLQAIGYLFKKNPHTRLKWNHEGYIVLNSNTKLELYEKSKYKGNSDIFISAIHMEPFSNYKFGLPTKKFIDRVLAKYDKSPEIDT